MKKEKLTSIAVSFVMALSAFSVPVGAFAAEVDSDVTDAQVNPPAVSEQEAEAEAPEAEAVTEETKGEPVEEGISDNEQQVPTTKVEGSYAEKNTEPKMSIFSISEKNEKYRQYLNSEKHFADDADIDALEIYGTFSDPDVYNEELLEAGGDESLKISPEDIMGIKITAKVGNKTYTGNVVYTNQELYAFTIKFAKAALGTPVTVTYQMGDITKTDKMVVSKWVHPKYTVKNFTYDGKYHKGAMVIKIGKQTLKQGKDYYISSEPIKDVGMSWVGAYSIDGNKYRFGTDEDGFKINPKGTSVKKLKKAKKAFTVKWKMQAMKMSKSRITGYQIQYSTSKKFTKKTTKIVTVKGYKNTSKKIKKLKKKTKYYVKVRTYKLVQGEKYNSNWSKVKAVRTK